jgi:hypothetical protein
VTIDPAPLDDHAERVNMTLPHRVSPQLDDLDGA